MKCPYCGTENENRNVCKKCGKFIQGKKLRPKDLDPKMRREVRRRHFWQGTKSCILSTLLMVGGLVALTLLMLLIFWGLSHFIDFDALVGSSYATDASGQVVTDQDGSAVLQTADTELETTISASESATNP